MDGVAASSTSLASLRREAPIHGLMIVVMIAAMLVGTTAAMLAGGLVLVVVAIGCAAAARRATGAVTRHLAAQCLDLWAMALGMLALVHPAPGGRAEETTHHALALPGWGLYLVVVATWAVARAAHARAGGSWGPRRGLATVLVTAASLGVMPLLM